MFQLSAHSCALIENPSNFLPQHTSKFEKLLLWFNEFTMMSKSNRHTLMYFRSNATFKAERKRHLETKEYKYIIHPFSSFRLTWDVYLMCVTIIILLYYPMTIYAYNENRISSTVKESIIKFLDISCMINVIVQFYTGYCIPENSEVVLDPVRVIHHYIYGLFIFDYLSSLPVHFLYLKLSLTHFPRCLLLMLKLYHLKTLLHHTRKLLEVLGIMQYFSLIKYIILTLVVTHWTAICYFLVPLFAKYYRHDNSWQKSWIYNQIKNQNLTEFQIYQICFYQAVLHMLSIGENVHQPTFEDMLLTIFTLIVGSIYFTLLFVLLLNAVVEQSISDIWESNIVNQLEQYMKSEGFPMDIQQRLLMYYNFRLSTFLFKENRINGTLSSRLKTEVSVYSCKKTLKQIDMFASLSDSALKKVIVNLKKEILLPNDILIKSGSKIDSLYVIAKGTLAVYVGVNEKEISHLHERAVVGQVELLTHSHTTATITALEVCVIWALSEEIFTRVFANASPQVEIISSITL